MGKTTTIAQRYYLLSAVHDAASVNRSVRGHWGIENRVHWVLDVTFDEDRSRSRSGATLNDDHLARVLGR